MKTSELIGPALDWAVAKAEGRVLHVPEPATNEDLAKLHVPFQLYGTVCIRHDDKQHWTVEEVTIRRFGIYHELGATAPSISFTDGQGRLCSGSASLFYLTREAAQADADQENLGGLEGFEPSTDWSQGGPIIDAWGKEVGLSLYFDPECVWYSVPPSPVWVAVSSRYRYRYAGPTPLIATMRCFCSAKLGDYVDVPEELCQQQNS